MKYEILIMQSSRNEIASFVEFVLAVLPCHWSDNEAISLFSRDCFVMEFILSLPKDSSQ